MHFNDLLLRNEIDPTSVLVLRHKPSEPELRRVFQWLAAERNDVFNAYQQTQTPNVEAAMQRAGYVASFVGHEAGRALFVGLYRQDGFQPVTKEEYWAMPVHQELSGYGMRGYTDDRAHILRFELKETAFYDNWKGRLVVEWPAPERSWWRWAHRNEFPVQAVHPDSLLESEMPPWEAITLTMAELMALPRRWRSALEQWRGIYYVLDASDGKGYVGSAYGAQNIFGRWSAYANTGHGGNAELRRRQPDQFRFSILQRVSPDLEAAEIIRLEATWKERLHTREFGLNKN